ISPGMTNPKKREASAHVSTKTAQSATDAGIEKKSSMKRPIRGRLSAVVETRGRETHSQENRIIGSLPAHEGRFRRAPVPGLGKVRDPAAAGGPTDAAPSRMPAPGGRGAAFPKGRSVRSRKAPRHTSRRRLPKRPRGEPRAARPREDAARRVGRASRRGEERG